jgi:hypothetical protein
MDFLRDEMKAWGENEKILLSLENNAKIGNENFLSFLILSIRRLITFLISHYEIDYFVRY